MKISYNEDLRRLSVPSSTPFDIVLEQVRKMFNLGETTHILLKYTDDEGDQVSITSQDELAEAFRVCGVLRPPILRVSVSVVGTRPPVVIAKEEVQTQPLDVQSSVLEPFLKKEPSQPTSLTVEEPREYPPLDVSLWDAPAKQTLASVPEQIPEKIEPVKLKIGQQMRRECIQTSEEVNRVAKEIRLETSKLADLQRAESLKLASQQRRASILSATDITNLMEKDSTASICSSLSKQIMEECKRLSQETAKLSSQLADLQKERILKAPEHNIAKEVSDLCRQTATMCRELCEATAAISE